MTIRNAIALDKTKILKFCKNTFSWGDYIEQVWDFWLDEGNLFLYEDQDPVGICHSFHSNNQIWIEGIRINPNFRRQKIASKLVKHAESIGREKNIQFSFMLIDTENTSSLSLANSLGYTIQQTWNFYSLQPRKKTDFNIQFENSLDRSIFSHYVKSWRWIPIDNDTLSTFYEHKKIIKSTEDGNTIAILSDSEHFDRTLIVTLFSGSKNSTIQVISYLQNHGVEKNYERIQILAKEKIPQIDLLEHRISFHLMKKSLF